MSVEPQREWFEKDYYRILGVDEKAPASDVTKAYRKLAKKLHPDANPGDDQVEDKFKEVSAAYDVLGDAEKREAYDEVRRLGPMTGAFGGGGRAGPGGRFGEGFNLNFTTGGLDGLLSNLFGRRQDGPRRGEDVETDLRLDFADAVAGTIASVTVVGEAACSACDGSGAEPPSTPAPCQACAGSGTLAEDQGLFSFSRPCAACSGRGRVIDDPCKSCGGRGVERRPRQVKARIPPGVADGQRVRIKARGAPGRGGERGDLYVRVHVDPHPLFDRDGRNLTLGVPVTFAEAVLGAEVDVPTLDGSTVTIRIPPATTPGTRLRIRGSEATRGADIIVEVELALPKRLSQEQRSAVEAFAKAPGEDPRAHLKV